MPVTESDITVYDPNDWEVQVDGVAMKQPAKFTLTPEFAADDALIETLEGEAGFSINSAASRGTLKFALKQTSPSRPYVDGLTQPGTRKVVSIFLVCRRNQARYPIKSRGFAFSIIKPAEENFEKAASDVEYEAIGFGYKQT